MLKKKTLSKRLSEYYKGDLNNPEDLKEINREPWPKTVLRQDLNTYIESDTDMIALLTKIAYQEEVVLLLEDILKMINTFFKLKKFLNGRTWVKMKSVN